MNFWWELYDKYEDELEELAPEDEEQEDLDALPDDGECPADDLWPKQKKQKKKAKKVGKWEEWVLMVLVGKKADKGEEGAKEELWVELVESDVLVLRQADFRCQAWPPDSQIILN